MPHGAGPAMVGAGARMNVDLWVDAYTPDAEAKMMAVALVEGGPLLGKDKSPGRQFDRC
jgi:hypothetical protein